MKQNGYNMVIYYNKTVFLRDYYIVTLIYTLVWKECSPVNC